MRYLLVVLIVAGCATPEERAEEAIARHAPYCEKLGFEKASDGWRNCIMSEEQARRGRAASSAAASQPRPRQPVTCTTTGMITTCN